jgi:hypothetical protein
MVNPIRWLANSNWKPAWNPGGKPEATAPNGPRPAVSAPGEPQPK